MATSEVRAEVDEIGIKVVCHFWHATFTTRNFKKPIN